MVTVGNKAKHFSSVNHTTKTIHYLHHHNFFNKCLASNKGLLLRSTIPFHIQIKISASLWKELPLKIQQLLEFDHKLSITKMYISVIFNINTQILYFPFWKREIQTILEHYRNLETLGQNTLNHGKEDTESNQSFHLHILHLMRPY